MRSQSADGSREFGSGWRHPLVFAAVIWRRIVINRESGKKVAHALGLEKKTLDGVVRILRAYRGIPSEERLAVAAMIVPDVTDADIAAWWDRDEEWAAHCRRHASNLRACEQFPLELEYVDDGYQPGDPSPDEIRQQTLAVRAAGRRNPSGHDTPRAALPGIRSFAWRFKRASFVPTLAD